MHERWNLLSRSEGRFHSNYRSLIKRYFYPKVLQVPFIVCGDRHTENAEMGCGAKLLNIIEDVFVTRPSGESLYIFDIRGSYRQVPRCTCCILVELSRSDVSLSLFRPSFIRSASSAYTFLRPQERWMDGHGQYGAALQLLMVTPGLAQG